MPLGGILLTVLTPALLIVTGGKVIRMTLIGTILIPIYLWSATLVSNFVTSASIEMNNFPKGLSEGQLFTSIDSNPIEKIIAIILGKGWASFDVKYMLIAAGALIIYILIFIWYRKELKAKAE